MEVQLNINDLLLSNGFDGQTAWNIAAEERNKEILQKLWCWGGEVQLNLKDDLFLSKCFDGQTTWNIAAEECKK